MKKFFATPVNGSNFNAALGDIAGIELLGLAYDRQTYRFTPLDADGNRLVSDLVVATDPIGEDVSEAAAAAHIRAVIDATNP